ncbi:MAG: hypothetical protein ACQESU_04725 [Halobacteriota archaeon]
MEEDRRRQIDRIHLIVLQKVIEKGPIGILKLAEETGMPTHKVRYSLRVLEQEHLIKPSSHGAMAGDMAQEFVEKFNEDLGSILEKVKYISDLGDRL